MRIALYFFFGILCLLSPACAEQTPSGVPPHLYADFYIRYLAASRELSAEARLAEGPDPLQAPPSPIEGGIQFQGAPMQLEQATGKPPRYTWRAVTAFPSSLFFQYQRQGESQRQEMNLLPVGRLVIQSPFQPEQGFTFTAGGSLLRGNETLVLLLADAENRAQSFTIEGPTADTLHRIPAGAFADLANGPATVYLVKRLKKTVAQAHQTINATIEYYTDTLRVQVANMPED